MQFAGLAQDKQQGGNMQDQEQGFSFTGTGGEYFRIWIVNLFLTIITLGIYSAWAKVRRLQYFYRNTWLNDSSFDFHGKPISILKGRLIAVGMFVAYNITLKMMPMVGLSILLLIIIVMPVLLVKSFRFRLYYTSYRGLRFGFFGSVKSAYFNFKKSLAMRPTSPFAWSNVAVAKLRIGEIDDERISVITPSESQARGCQLSIRVKNADKSLFESITSRGVFADWREPDVIRVAPVPLYTSFSDVLRFSEILKEGLR